MITICDGMAGQRNERKETEDEQGNVCPICNAPLQGDRHTHQDHDSPTPPLMQPKAGSVPPFSTKARLGAVLENEKLKGALVAEQQKKTAVEIEGTPPASGGTSRRSGAVRAVLPAAVFPTHCCFFAAIASAVRCLLQERQGYPHMFWLSRRLLLLTQVPEAQLGKP